MKSFFLGKILGIELELHWTFVFLAIGLALFLAIFDLANLFPTFTLFFFLFLSVFLHELSHSVVALQRGFSVEKIIFLPIGGVAVTDSISDNPKDEFLIAIAGPVFNFIVVLSIMLIVSVFPLPFPHGFFSGTLKPEQIQIALTTYPLFGLLWVNFILGVFNLFLPALPLDGGRVFRALLSFVFSPEKATRIITKISIFIAFLLFLFGLFAGGIILIIISVFVYFGAKQELQLSEFKNLLGNKDFTFLINKNPPMIDSFVSLEEAFEKMLQTNKTFFLTKTNQDFGIITAKMISKQKIKTRAVFEIAQKLSEIHLPMSSSKIAEKILTQKFPVFLVFENNSFIGIFEASEIEKFAELQKLKKSH